MEMEDKKCRICGLADMDNFNIFQSKALPAKIVAVFPIALYRNDPLPKHICKKCHLCTHNMYTEMERALRNQSKWITNIRTAQPDNQYLKVVDSIAGANKQTSQLVSLIAGSEIGERTVSKLFNYETDNYTIPRKRAAIFDNILPESNIIDENEDLSADCTEAELIAQEKNPPPQASLSKPPEAKITQLKSVLELNGCTLTKLKPTIKSSPGSQKKKSSAIEEIKIDIKEEPLDEQRCDPVHVEQSEQMEAHQVRCKMCPFSCETIEEQAIHQLEHLSVATWKLSERRILNKRIRRGRLIMVEEKKCIRCLNCWRIFADNKSILKHWSEGDCDFFCQICGKEFATSPKMLREHIPAAHGISYRSSKILRPHTLVPRKPTKNEKSPSKSSLKSIVKTEPSSQRTKSSPSKNKSSKPPPNGSLTVKVACSICLKVFANFKARNSHMRAHKHPPFLPARPPPSLNETLIALNRTDMLQIKDEPLEIENTLFQGINPQEAAVPSTSRAGPAFSKVNPTATKHPRLKVIPTRTGVRKKPVQKPSNPNPVVIKTEPRSMSAESIKVKSLVELQDPAVSSQLPEDPDKLFLGESSTATPMLTSPPCNGAPSINGLSIDFTPKDNMNYSQSFTCHPCGLKFNSKLELFRHKRKCSANNLFPCQFCEKHFLTSADLQMHIMLLHKSSSTQ